MDILIEAGADPVSMDRNGKIPLYYAARTGRDELITTLQCVDEFRSDTNHELGLAFFEAIEAGEADVVVCLVENMHPNIIMRRSSILFSIHAGHLNILEILLVHWTDFSCPLFTPSERIPLHQAIKHGRSDMAKLLLDHGADIQMWDRKSRNATFETLKAPNTDGLSLLLDRGILVECRDGAGNTVLHQAAMKGPVEHARLLIDQDIIPKNAFNNEGLTPLHLAARADQFEIAEMLLKCEGVDVNTEATGRATGWTPLMYAVVAGSLRLCHMLIRRGADVNKEGTERPTVFKLAQEGGDRDVKGLLETTRIRSRYGSRSKNERILNLSE